MAACSSSSSGTQASGGGKDCTVKALFVGPITGDAALFGTGTKIGIQNAAAQVNAAGGVNGCTLKVTYADDQSDVTQTLPVLQGALANNSYSFVAETGFGVATTVPYLTRQKILTIVASGQEGLANPKTNPYLFDTDISGSAALQPIVQYAVEQGHKDLGMVTDNTSVGQSELAGAQESLAQAGGSLVSSVQVADSTTNMTPAVQRLRASGATAIIVDLYGPPAAYFLRDLAASGWKPKVYGSQDVFATDLGALLPLSDYAGITVAGPSVATAPSWPVAQAFINRLTAEKVNLQQYLLPAATGHDMMTLFAWAANATKSTNTQTLAQYIQQHGSTAVPNLVLTQPQRTAYTPSNHEWLAPGSLASAIEGPLDSAGRLKRTSFLN